MAYRQGCRRELQNVKPEAIAAFDAWSGRMGFSKRRDAFLYLTRAMAGGRVAVMDKLTRDILVGAAKEEVMREVRPVAQQEAKIVLWELGFIEDPGPLGIDPLCENS